MSETTDGARCLTCNVLLSQHLGLYGTCREHLLARAEVERLTAELARVEGELEAVRAEVVLWKVKMPRTTRNRARMTRERIQGEPS